MQLNWAERLVVNNPVRILEQRHEVRWMREKNPLPAGTRLLEVGCGRGAGAAIIVRHYQPAVLHAVDLDLRMIRKASRYVKAHLRDRIALHVADAEHLPFRSGRMDGVFGFGVLHHVPDWRRALAEMARVLKPGGVYCLEEFYPPAYQNWLTRRLLVHPREDRFFSADLRAALSSAGFALKAVKELPVLGILAVCVKEG
jgi:ubiquinone/menaquinone biosynthesis C-methylase UbiE